MGAGAGYGPVDNHNKCSIFRLGRTPVALCDNSATGPMSFESVRHRRVVVADYLTKRFLRMLQGSNVT